MTDYQTKEGRLERRQAPRSTISPTAYGIIALLLILISASDLML